MTMAAGQTEALMVRLEKVGHLFLKLYHQVGEGDCEDTPVRTGDCGTRNECVELKGRNAVVESDHQLAWQKNHESVVTNL